MYPDVEVNTDEPPLVFKAQLFALTGVNPTRQKVMMKGGTLKDDVWGNIQIIEGQNILMMGSKDEDVPVEPTVKTMFVEDMTETQLATVVSFSYFSWLKSNFKTTCYLLDLLDVFYVITTYFLILFCFYTIVHNIMIMIKYNNRYKSRSKSGF